MSPISSDRGLPAANSVLKSATGLTRQRVADQVFQVLARSILTGELAHGQPLATQRALAKRFEVSPVVVRQAVHRLEDLGLLRVRQGCTTIVLDPGQSDDFNLVKLRLRLQADSIGGMTIDAYESQLLFLLPVLVLVERRITPQEVAVLDGMVDRGATEATGEAGINAFRLEYWGQLVKATRNAIFEQQLLWWTHVIHEPDRHQVLPFSFYRTLNRRLAAGEGAPECFLQAIQPRLESFDGERADARAPSRGSTTASAATGLDNA